MELASPFGIGARDSLSFGPGLPDAQHPDPVKSLLCEGVQLAVRDVIQRRTASEGTGQFRQPDSRIDLVQRWIADLRHRYSPSYCAGYRSLGRFAQLLGKGHQRIRLVLWCPW